MSDVTQVLAQTPRTPLQFWAVGILSLFWNGFLASDYVAAQSRSVAYLSVVTNDVNASLVWADSSPQWAIAAWAISVWSAVAGSLLLLFRSRYSVIAFLVALVATVINSANQCV